MANASSTKSATASESSAADELEFWIAVTAGEAVWADAEEELGPIERGTANVELFALASCATLIWTAVLASQDTLSGFSVTAPWLATAALLLMMVRPLRLVLGFRRQADLWPSFMARIVLVTTVVASSIPNSPLFGVLSMWPFAVALGAEAALCAWVIGIEIRPWQWWNSFLRSGLHLGILGAAAASIVYVGFARTLTAIAPIYIVMHVCVLGGAIAAGALGRYRDSLIRSRDEAVSASAAAVHRQSAHWLHDDVSSELKLTELRLRNNSLGPGDVANALANLDHTLRLRQLDELFRSGTIRLAEILQPYVRDAQGHDIKITDVPTFDDASAMVDETLGRLFGRAVSVVTTNAILAGASELGFAVSSTGDTVTLSVTDDAGGFELTEVPAGRGLWQLTQDPGSVDLTVEPSDKGTTVTITLARSAVPSQTSNNRMIADGTTSVR